MNQRQISQILIMALVVNLVRTVPSARFNRCCWRNPSCDFHVTHTPKCNEPAKIGQIIKYGITIFIVAMFSLCRLRITTELRSGAVDKMKWPVNLQNASGNPNSLSQAAWIVE